MAKAVNTQTGVTVTADEAVLRRLGPQWEVQADKPAKPAARRKSKKSE